MLVEDAEWTETAETDNFTLLESPLSALTLETINVRRDLGGDPPSRDRLFQQEQRHYRTAIRPLG